MALWRLASVPKKLEIVLHRHQAIWIAVSLELLLGCCPAQSNWLIWNVWTSNWSWYTHKTARQPEIIFSNLAIQMTAISYVNFSFVKFFEIYFPYISLIFFRGSHFYEIFYLVYPTFCSSNFWGPSPKNLITLFGHPLLRGAARVPRKYPPICYRYICVYANARYLINLFYRIKLVFTSSSAIYFFFIVMYLCQATFLANI